MLTSNYGAQYGRNGSGTVETITKSGTRDFHGDLFEFLRNEDFNASNFFQIRRRPEYKKNDYGYTIGGPVFIPKLYNTNQEKTFFFFSEEWRKELVPGTDFQPAGSFDGGADRQFLRGLSRLPSCPVNATTNRSPYHPAITKFR